ncbi:MAG: hypothetical protein FJZ59_03320 [Chlamydiae bacterium]|jgi:hypothetical protein|nr:hypothetical protein [Chlamydiota bacterium]
MKFNKILAFLLVVTSFAYAEESILELREFVVNVSDNEGKAIEEIVTTLGTHSLVSLGFKKAHLKELGQGLKGIGCLHFLGYIFKHKELRAHMKTIQKSSFKWNGFMEGLKPGFERSLKSSELLQELPSFAALTKVDHEKLLAKAKESNWDEFVGILVEATP